MLTIEEPSPLADVTACRACGHLIAGLPPVGRCPECGGPYDRHEFVLFGRQPREAWAAWGSLCASCLLAAMYLRRPSTWVEAGVGVCYAIGAAAFVAESVARLMAVRPGSARVRLSRAGYAVDTEPPPRPVLLRAVTAVRTAVGRRPRGAAAAPWQMGVPVPWAAVRHVRVTPARGGRWRVRLVRRPGDRSRVPAAVVVDATPEQMAALRAFAGRFTRQVEG